MSRAFHHYPVGIRENSPAFQRRDSSVREPSPEGTIEIEHSLNRLVGTARRSSMTNPGPGSADLAQTISGLRHEEALTGNSKLRHQEIPRLLRASLRRWPAAGASSSAASECHGGELIHHTLRFERAEVREQWRESKKQKAIRGEQIADGEERKLGMSL